METRQLAEAMDSHSYHVCCHLSSPVHLRKGRFFPKRIHGLCVWVPTPQFTTAAVATSNKQQQQLHQHHQHHHHHHQQQQQQQQQQQRRQRNWGTDTRCHDELLASSTLGDLLMSGERKLQDGDAVVRDRPCGNDPWNGEHLIPCLPQSWFSGKWMYLQY